MLPDRWTPLDPHPEQMRLVGSPARFCVVAAGRRSGKTERAKRRLVLSCLDPPRVHRPNYVACAPVRDQAKRIFWQDLKDLSPPRWVDHISESELSIRYRTGATLSIVGLDRPQRAEGLPIDGAVIDEYAEVKAEAWTQSLRPALSTKGRAPGWCWFTGRPKGGGHFRNLWQAARTTEGWDAFHWKSADILDAAEIAAAKRDLDDLTFRQEYEAEFVTFEGLAYYCWSPGLHLRQLEYKPDLSLVFCFDFNVDPGVAVIIQEQVHGPDAQLGLTEPTNVTCIVGEVYIPLNSNTPAVCRKLAQDWAHHNGPVLLYGDATGTQRRTSGVHGNDWDLIKEHLRPTFSDLRDRVQRSNPHERDRVNSVNSRLKNAHGQVRLLMDPKRAPNVVKDFEGVALLKGGSGEIDKKRTPELTHLTDALGYYVHEKHPLGGHTMKVH